MGSITLSPRAPDGTGNASLTHPDRIWLAEIVRRIEASAWLDDADTLRRIPPSTDTARILRRAELLGESKGIVGEITAWRARGRTAFTVFAALALGGGFLVAASALGDGSRAVNIILALATLLGIHFLTLIIWGVSVLSGARATPGVSAMLWRRLTASAAGSHHRPVILEALIGMLARARLLPWIIGGVSHALWCLTFLGVLGGLLFMLAFREYHFNWHTTILPTEFFITMTQTLGKIPQVLGFLTPDAAMVRGVSGGESVQSAWASWLIGCVVVYGLLPRTVLALICLIRSRRGLSRLGIDHSLSYYIELKNRIRAAEGASAIIDPDSGERSFPGISRGATAGSGHGKVLVGIEIIDDSAWPPCTSNTGVKTWRVASGNERRQLLQFLSATPAKQLLIACDAHSSPDRGTLRLIAEIRTYAEQCKLWLTARHDRAASPDRLAYWREELGNIGLRADDVIEDERRALDWLEQGDE